MVLVMMEIVSCCYYRLGRDLVVDLEQIPARMDLDSILALRQDSLRSKLRHCSSIRQRLFLPRPHLLHCKLLQLFSSRLIRLWYHTLASHMPPLPP